jgi:hypothetical protein
MSREDEKGDCFNANFSPMISALIWKERNGGVGGGMEAGFSGLQVCAQGPGDSSINHTFP